MGNLNRFRIELYDDGLGERLAIDTQVMGEMTGPAARWGVLILNFLSALHKDVFGMEIPYPPQVMELIDLHTKEQPGDSA